MQEMNTKPLFNPEGDTEVQNRRILGGNTTNLNDFNNMKYTWVSDWYRQAMNNFWIPEEINMSGDVNDYKRLTPAERRAYDKILSFLVFLDSIQTETSTARQFMFIARCKSSKSENILQKANRVEKIISDQGFEVTRMKKADIKRFLAIYFDASMNGDLMPDYDGEQYFEKEQTYEEA